MARHLVALAALLCLLCATAEAQVNVLKYNNPTNQAGMYNNSAVLRYNNPMNQAGMYGNSAVLRYNNPLNQAGMYGNSAVLRYNNPTVQGNMYTNVPGLFYNNPTNQAGMYNGQGFNNPLYQGNFNGFGFNNPLNQAGMYGPNPYVGGSGWGRTGQAIGTGRGNPSAAAVLNGQSGGRVQNRANRQAPRRSRQIHR